MTYTCLLDTRRDATFTGANDDITAYVLDATWGVGMADSYDEVARPSQLTLTLRNNGGEFNTEYTGAELLTNGNFTSWSVGNPSNWTVTGESGSDPEVSQVGASKVHGEGGTGKCNLYTTGTVCGIYQTVLTVGIRYKAVFTVDHVDGTGGVVIKSGVTAMSPVYHVAGIKTVYFTATNTTFKIETDGAANVTIDDVSVKATTPYAGALTRGTMVRLKYNATVLYDGKISSITPMFGTANARTVSVVVQDAMLQLLDADYQAELLTNTTIDAAFNQIFDKAVVAYPYAHTYWMLEVEGSSELGTTTTLYNHTATDFDVGSTTLAYIGDNLDQGRGVNAQTVIRELIATEFGGRFYFQPRTGKYTFDSRHTDVLYTTNDASYPTSTAEMTTTTTTQGDDLANIITVDYEPRSVGAAGTVIWSAPNLPISLDVGEAKTFKIRYRDPDNEQTAIGATNVLPLQCGLDVIANRAADGSGQDLSSYINFTLQAGASSADLIVWTRGAKVKVYVTTLQLRGTPILRYPRESKTAQSGDSFRDTEYRVEKQYSVMALGDGDTAEAGANWYLGKFRAASVRVKQMTLVMDDKSAGLSAALALTIGNRINVTDSGGGHNADYFIVGEQHKITAGGDNVHQITWLLKPASREKFWLLEVSGRSELDGTTLLAF